MACPRCGRCARVTGRTRLTCAHCGLARTEGARRQGPGRGVPTDPCFDLPLWLVTDCAGHTLWAYNGRHLAWLEDWIGASLRERRPTPTFGIPEARERWWSNASMASRLPRWMKLRRNRSAVLAALARLRARLLA